MGRVAGLPSAFPLHLIRTTPNLLFPGGNAWRQPSLSLPTFLRLKVSYSRSSHVTRQTDRFALSLRRRRRKIQGHFLPLSSFYKA